MSYDNTWGWIVIAIILLIFICSCKCLSIRRNYQRAQNEDIESATNSENNNLSVTENTPVIDKNNESHHKSRLYTVNTF